MAKFCSNCGNAVNEVDNVCSQCGNPLKSNVVNINKKISNASLILGIIGLYFCFSAFTIMGEPVVELPADEFKYKFSYAIGFVLLQTIFGVIGIIKSLNERKEIKTTSNTWGFWLSLSSLTIAAIQFVLVLINI